MDNQEIKHASKQDVYFRNLLNISFGQAHELVKQYGSPLLVLSPFRVKNAYLSLARALPQAQIFYAMKSNSHPDILKTLKKLGSSFESASYAELKMITSIGINPKEVLNTQPFLSKKDFCRCYELGQRWFVVDNPLQLKRFLSVTNDLNLLVRLSFPNRNCQVDLSYKFGATISDAYRIITEAYNAGVKVRGVSFHVGSQSYSTKNYIKALKAVRNLFNDCKRKGIKLDTLDIGGGFPVPYTKYVPPIEHFALPIRRKLSKLFPNTKIWVEPGRFISGLSMNLITTVNGKNIRKGIPWYYLDDGVYNSFSGKVYDHCSYEIVPEKDGPVKRSVLAGPTCDSFDIITDRIRLPELNIGDVILVPSMGSYSSISATNYHGFNKAKIVTIK
ncbi:MAG: type III PLP-dependent enzyme [Candidatus Magasanikbacteria bacterium]